MRFSSVDPVDPVSHLNIVHLAAVDPVSHLNIVHLAEPLPLLSFPVVQCSDVTLWLPKMGRVLAALDVRREAGGATSKTDGGAGAGNGSVLMNGYSPLFSCDR